MKFVLIIVLITIVMLIAVGVANQIKDKHDFYVNLASFLEELKININFKQEKLDEFLLKQNPKKQFKQFIASYENYLKNNELNLSEIKILDENEKKDLENIVKNIGKFDIKNELNQLDMFLLNIKAKLKESEADKKKLCPLIIKLSLLFALAVAILLL